MNSTGARIYGGRPMAVRRAERRAKFIDAGMTIFGESGYSSSSVAEICSVAGLARSQFYAEFDSREDLLLDIYDTIQNDTQTAVVDALTREGGGAYQELTTVAMTALVESMGSDPRRARITYVEMIGVSPRVEKHRTDRRAEWAEFIKSTMVERIDDEFTPPGGHELAAIAFLGALTELVHHWSIRDPQPPITDLIDLMTALLNALIPHAS